MDYCIQKTQSLPDIVMYGGDTTPWIVELVDDAGTRLIPNEGEQYTCTLTFLPYSVSSGMNEHAVWVSPAIDRTTQFMLSDNGAYTAVFHFLSDDTRSLRGKFTYQIEVTCSTRTRVSQGKLTILANHKRKVGT